MRFLADMGISPDTVHWLRARGHDAVHAADYRLHRATDSEIIARAQAEGRIVITHDLDFGTLMAASHSTLPSVILFRLTNMRPERVTSHLELILERHEDALEAGAILVITERRVRIRRLPI